MKNRGFSSGFKFFGALKSGFTLIELLVVVAIIGLLSAIVLVGLNASRLKARNAKRVADIRQIQNALEMYASDHGGQYPSTGGALACLGVSSSEQCWGGPLGNDALNAALLPYLSQAPKDPLYGNRIYGAYAYRSPGNWWLPAPDGWHTGSYSVAFEPDKLCPQSDSDCLGWKFASWDESPPGPHCPASGCCRHCGYLAD